MAVRPSEYPRWASQDVIDNVTGVNNVTPPPESKRNVGHQRAEPIARQFVNWLGRLTYEWILYFDERATEGNNSSDGTGAQVITQEDVMVILSAVDSTTPANYIQAIGYRAAGAATFNVTSSNVLALGTLGADGSVEITGGTAGDIIVNVTMHKA